MIPPAAEGDASSRFMCKAAAAADGKPAGGLKHGRDVSCIGSDGGEGQVRFRFATGR